MVHHTIICCADTLQCRPPEFQNHDARKALWLVDQNFEDNKRDQLRLKIEGLSIEWKKTLDMGQNRSDDSDGEVEFG